MISNNFFSFIIFFLFGIFMYKQRELIGLFCGLKKEHWRVKDKKIFFSPLFWYFFSSFFILYIEKRFLIVQPGEIALWLSPDFLFLLYTQKNSHWLDTITLFFISHIIFSSYDAYNNCNKMHVSIFWLDLYLKRLYRRELLDFFHVKINKFV